LRKVGGRPWTANSGFKVRRWGSIKIMIILKWL